MGLERKNRILKNILKIKISAFLKLMMINYLHKIIIELIIIKIKLIIIQSSLMLLILKIVIQIKTMHQHLVLLI